MHRFAEALSTGRVLIFDGAMGTQVQALDLDLDAYRGQEGNTDVLCLTRPDDIAAIHERYFAAGADCVETNTFGANLVVQAEFDNPAADVLQMNIDAARIAREVASGFEDRFVIGSMGPGTKAPSLGQASFSELSESYRLQARGLMQGGADTLIVETVFDILQAKAALAGIMDAFSDEGASLPVIAQVTIETTGTMLLGTEMQAAIAALDTYQIVDVLGINCATGPHEMTEHVRTLTRGSRKPVSVQPNAGLPAMRDGVACYDLTPEQLLASHRVFVGEFGVQLVGGCCGTTPEHIRILADGLRGTMPAARDIVFEPSVSSLYSAQPLRQDTSIFMIGERCNTQGSRRFKALVEADDWEGTLEVAAAQVRDGAHALDLSVDFTGRDGVADMTCVIERFRTEVTLPIVLDSTEPEVIEAGLERYGGRAVINSINLEEGRGETTRLERNLRAARRYAAAVVALAIDEKGQATTAGWKVEVCSRLMDIATTEYGLEPHDVIFDPIVLPISTGMEETRRAGIETLEAIAELKRRYPTSSVSLGISNVSFGLSPAARQVLNSVFLHEAVERGLDAAIVHAGQILPRARIDDEAYRLARALVHDDRSDGDPLTAFIEVMTGVEGPAVSAGPDLDELPLDERLVQRIVEGARKGLEPDLDEALGSRSALQIVNESLLEGMRIVGERFATGEMQLPFVLRSAETMKAAVAHLEPHMEKVEGETRGTIVLATVKGDVHDIGKNLVDIILTNNGYRVINLGIKQPINSIIEAVESERADAIGLSGLLVKSTLVMRDDLEELNRRNLSELPVLLGGAALTRTYVEHDLRKLYEGQVFYGRDAFEGLRTMDALMTAKRGGEPVAYQVKEKRVAAAAPKSVPSEGGRSDVATDVPIPTPPFLGSRVVKGIGIAEVAEYLNRTALFRGQWRLTPTKGESPDAYRARLADQAEPELRRLLAWCQQEQILQPAVVYGYFHANSEGNTLMVQGDTGEQRFTFPRQTRGRRLCIADFFRPVGSEPDVVAFHLVTMGRRVSQEAERLFSEDQYTEYLYLHGLGVEMAEALAELWHARIREELGIAGQDGQDLEALFDQGYRGSRYSFGYPACPNLEDQQQLFALLDPSRIGVELTEEFQLEPEQSTTAIIVHHPEAKYFSVGRA
ncbi:MAG: methionine synthase [Actinomycetota bacterium]